LFTIDDDNTQNKIMSIIYENSNFKSSFILSNYLKHLLLIL